MAGIGPLSILGCLAKIQFILESQFEKLRHFIETWSQIFSLNCQLSVFDVSKDNWVHVVMSLLRFPKFLVMGMM